MRNKDRRLRALLLSIAFVQLGFGLAFVLVPSFTVASVNLSPAPAWAGWLFAMMGARFLGYSVGMFVASRDPVRHLSWIWTMAGVQVVDWTSTILHLARGDIALPYVTTAAVFPVLFVVGIVAWAPRPLRRHRVELVEASW